MEHKYLWGISNRSPNFYLHELLKEVKIGTFKNALLHWNEIFMKFLDMYIFLRFDQGKVCLCACKIKASAQDIRLESYSG